MKSLEEKKLLLKFAKIFGEPIDPALVESIEREERLLKALKDPPWEVTKEPVAVEETVVEEVVEINEQPFHDIKSVKTKTTQDDEATEQQTLLPPNKEAIIKSVVDLLDAPKQKTTPSSAGAVPDLYRKEIDGLRRSIADVIQKMGTLAWGGGGSGSVKIIDMDDLNREGLANIDHVMRYNAATQHFFFDNLSGDQGPIRSMRFDLNGPGINTEPGMITWNNVDECLDVHQTDNTTLQVGLEQYIRVTNHTGVTMNAGTLVAFSGVNGTQNPSAEPLLANSTFYPSYTIGVLSEDIASEGQGRATTFGKVRDLDTGMFEEGDLLYASPANAGKLVNYQPTAPNCAVLVAAVMHKGNTDGVILVRPVITPRLHYGTFSDLENQNAASSNTATAVRFNITEFAVGHSIFSYNSGSNNAIKAIQPGLYNYQFSLQFTSTSSAKSKIWIWARKNGQDIPDSTGAITIDTNGGDIVPAWNYIVSMSANDVFQLMWATDTFDKVGMTYSASTAFCPAIPSALLSVSQVTL